MSELPPRLRKLVDLFGLVEDRGERIQMLIDIADRFLEVPETVATRPFGRENEVPHCESEAYVWGRLQEDGSAKFYFAVENPQGISAKAMAVILDETLSGERPCTVAEIPTDLPYAFFGRELSMGKTMGLMGMVAMVRNLGAGLCLAAGEP